MLKCIFEYSSFPYPGFEAHEALQDSEATGPIPVFCTEEQGMGIERTLVTFGHYRVQPWIFFFISWQRRVTGCMPAVPQLYKVSTSKPPLYQTWRQPYSSCRRPLAALRQQQLHSRSVAKRKVWSLCNSLPFSSLNWAMYLFQGTGTANFNKAKKSVYYQAIAPL